MSAEKSVVGVGRAEVETRTDGVWVSASEIGF